jgi:hypothetical protein
MDDTGFTHLVMFRRAMASVAMKRDKPPSVLHLPIACKITSDISNFFVSVIDKGYDAAPSPTGSSRSGTPAAVETHRHSCIHWLCPLDSGLVGWLSPLDTGLVKSSKLLLQQKVLGNNCGHFVPSVD